MKYSINKSLAKLSPDGFKSWFEARKFDGDWKAEYKKIGGKLSEPKRTGTKSKKD
jgi:hypothetical protein